MVKIIDSLNSVILEWNKADCLEGISHYRIYMDDTIIKNISGIYDSYIVNNLKQNVVYSFYIVGVTNEDRITAKSNTVDVMLTTAFQTIKLDFNLNNNL